MNYSKTIREYCLQNPGMVFDMSYEHERHFPMVPYKTFCKILARLETDNIISKYSKGIYLINTDNIADDPILAFYANDYTGLAVGYKMYNDLGISTHKEEPIIIYTNAMETTTKNIGDKYKLIQFNTIMFGSTKDLIVCLELIENRNKILECDFYKLNMILIELLKDYNDIELSLILQSHKYKYATIVTLDELLKTLNIKNNALKLADKLL